MSFGAHVRVASDPSQPLRYPVNLNKRKFSQSVEVSPLSNTLSYFDSIFSRPGQDRRLKHPKTNFSYPG